jgi:hypothetical protein
MFLARTALFSPEFTQLKLATLTSCLSFQVQWTSLNESLLFAHWLAPGVLNHEPPATFAITASFAV